MLNDKIKKTLNEIIKVAIVVVVTIALQRAALRVAIMSCRILQFECFVIMKNYVN